MADEILRSLERQWRQSGDDNSRRAFTDALTRYGRWPLRQDGIYRSSPNDRDPCRWLRFESSVQVLAAASVPMSALQASTWMTADNPYLGRGQLDPELDGFTLTTRSRYGEIHYQLRWEGAELVGKIESAINGAVTERRFIFQPLAPGSRPRAITSYDELSKAGLPEDLCQTLRESTQISLVQIAQMDPEQIAQHIPLHWAEAIVAWRNLETERINPRA